MRDVMGRLGGPAARRLRIAASCIGVLAGLAWPSAPVSAQTTSGNASTGGTYYTSKCESCHGTLGSLDIPNLKNAANAGYVIKEAINQGMAYSFESTCDGVGDNAFCQTELNDIAAYIATVVSTNNPSSQSITHNVTSTFTIPNIYIGSYANLTHGVRTDVAGPGVVTFSTLNGNLRAQYNPDAGACGNDTVSFRVYNPAETVYTQQRTFTVDIGNPSAPNITTSTNTKSGTYNVFLSYSPTNTGGTPYSYAITAGSLPSGVTLNTSTGTISGTPTQTGSFPITLQARNCLNGNYTGQTSSRAITFTIAKASQGALTARVNGSSADQSFTYLATPSVALSVIQSSPVGSGAVSYSSNNSADCFVSGSTLNLNGAGTCTITATRATDSNYLAVSDTIVVTVNPANQAALVATSTSFSVNFGSTATLSTSGGSGTGAVTYQSNNGNCSISGATLTGAAAGTCVVTATKAADANYNQATDATPTITINAIAPQPPTGIGASGGDATGTVSFTAPTNTGGSPLSGFTASCTSSNGGSPGSNTGLSSPIIVSGLTNGSLYTCRVTATNMAALTSAQSAASGSFTPSATPVAPTITSANNASFTVLSNGSFQVTATGVPASFTYSLSGTLPAGVTFNTVTGVLSGTPASGSASGASPPAAQAYPVTITVTNATGSTMQSFTLNVFKISQSINFPIIGDRAMRPVPFALGATATSGLPVTYAVIFSSQTRCSVTNGNMTMLNVGSCGLRALQAGNNDYASASTVSQSFNITQGDQAISFGAQAAQNFVAGGSFPLSPAAVSVDAIDLATPTGLAVTYVAQSTACSIVGTTVTMNGAGSCVIEAQQAGDANYMAAVTVGQAITINKANQVITWGTPANQAFGSGGTFDLATTATGGASGNGIVYSSLTTAVCTISGITVTKVSAGLCTLAANQAGNDDYNAAAQVTRGFTITASVPGAPALSTAVASDAQVVLQFDPPASDGGSAIDFYRGTCNPGGITADGANAPLTVTGLTNGVAYTCSVQAHNTAGFGTASNALNANPVLLSGETLWTNTCSGCHGAQPVGVRFNAAGTTGTILAYVRSIQPLMQANAAVQALTQNELAEISKYIATFVPAISVNTPFNTAVMVDVSSHLTLGTVTFTGAGIVTQPVNGTVGAFSGTVVTYTPNPGFVGQDTFTYRGTNGNPNPNGDPRTVTVTVAAPPAPVITSPAIFAATVGQMASYQITATNSPTGYNATTAMACNGAPISGNFTVNAMTGLISGTPATAGQVTVRVCAANAGGTGFLNVDVTVSKASQSITFNAQGGQSFSPAGTFMLSPTASASSGLTVAYSSLTTGVCTIAGTTVTMVTAGTCTIAANQAGNANFNAALQVTQDIAIAATVPGAPTIGMATPGDTQASIAFTAPANNGGSAITGYAATCNPGGFTGGGSASPVVVTGLANATTYTCSVRATNAAGQGVASGTVMVTPTATPVPPAINSANATTFTVAAAGTFSVQASGTPAPTLSVMGTLPSGVTFTPGTGALAGTPALGTVGGYPLTFTATNGSGSVMQSFTLTVQKANQSISFTGPASQPFSTSNIMLSASATSGLAVSFASNTTSVCTVSGTTLTLVTVGTCSITASQAGNANYNAASDVTQGFNVTQATQSITFGAQSSPLNFVAGSTFAINPVATASSGLAVSHSSTTTGVCTVLGTTVTMVAPGTCTLAANQSGSANYQAAPQVTRSVTLSATAPDAPIIGTATGGNGQATINFTAPTSNGGSAITGYTATCNPGGVTGTSAGSPIVVSGLTNSVAYTCSVTATNAVGTSAASGTVMVTPLSGQGAALWTQVCDTCHTAVPSGNQLNGAGTTATVLAYVRANQPLMSGFSPVASLSNADLADIAAYIAASLPENVVETPVNTPVQVNLGSHITLTGQAWSAFTSVEIVSGPANGSLGAVNGTQVQYTPNPGYLGGDSFTYRGKRAGTHDGDPQTITLTVTPAPPSITSATSAGGTFGSAFSYQTTATNSPTSFDATGLPAGLTVSPAGLISGTPTVVGNFSVGLSASNAGGTGEATLMLDIAAAPQVITFGAQTSPRNWSQGGTFAISPTATGGGSGNPIVYGSASTAVCTVSGTTVTIVAAGDCLITANQAGSATHATASQVTRTVVINAILPGAPTIGPATAGNGQASLAFTAPASNGGSAITGYTATCNPGGVTAGGAASPITVTGLANGVLHTCSVTATTSAGTGPASATVNVTPQSIVLAAVFSRKAHGGQGDHDIELAQGVPVTGAVTVEPRAIGGGHRIVFEFSGAVGSVGGASATDGGGMPVGTAGVTFAGNEVEVLLTGIPNQTRATVTVTGVNGGLTASITLGFLVGDSDGNRSVTAADLTATRARAGETTTAANFRHDVTANGTIGAADIAVTKIRSGQTLP